MPFHLHVLLYVKNRISGVRAPVMVVPNEEVVVHVRSHEGDGIG